LRAGATLLAITPEENDVAEVKVDNLTELWQAGAVKLPQVAVQYTELARDLHKTGLSQEAAFRRSIGGLGKLYYEWTRLRNLIQDEIAVRSHENLAMAGEALVMIANSYATTDHLSREQMEKYEDHIERIETGEDYRRPPQVLDAAAAGDPHPEEYPTGPRGPF
jgi:hypothetical protein